MSDTTKGGFQIDQAGQPVTPSPAPAAEQAPISTEGSTESTPQYVTRDEALKMAKEAASEAIRQAQSLSDKSTARIMKEIERLSKAGITATPEQVQKMIATEESQQEVSAQPAVQQTNQEQPSDPVVRKAVKIMQEALGKNIEQDAPEQKLINKETDDPEVFLASVREATAAYKERAANIGNPARMPTTATGGGNHVPDYRNRSGVDILEEYNKNHPL